MAQSSIMLPMPVNGVSIRMQHRVQCMLEQTYTRQGRACSLRRHFRSVWIVVSSVIVWSSTGELRIRLVTYVPIYDRVKLTLSSDLTMVGRIRSLKQS